MHLVGSMTTWYAARAGGILAYLLLTACVLAGIVLAGKRQVPGLPRFAVEDVHRFLGILVGTFVAIHVAGIALDEVVPFSVVQLVIPFTADYRPFATGLGVVALGLLLAVAVTNRARGRLPYRLWRRAHYATLAVWTLAVGHGILSGTDRSESWLLALYGGSVALVAGAAVVRFGGTSSAPHRHDRPAPVPTPPAAPNFDDWFRLDRSRTTPGATLPSARRGGRAVECGGLENRYPS